MAEANNEIYTVENKTISEKLQNLRNDINFVDFAFVTSEGTEVCCHKAILCQYSDVIASQWGGKDVTLTKVLCSYIDAEQDTQLHTIQYLVDFMYGLSVTIPRDHINQAMRFAVKLNILEFLAACDASLLDSKDSSEDISTNEISDVHNSIVVKIEKSDPDDMNYTDYHSPELDDNIKMELQDTTPPPKAKGRRKSKTPMKTKAVQPIKIKIKKPKLENGEDEGTSINPDDTMVIVGDAFEDDSDNEDTQEYHPNEHDVAETTTSAAVKAKKPRAKQDKPKPKYKCEKGIHQKIGKACTVCDQKFDAYSKLGEHKQAVHMLIACNVCGRSFETEAYLARHQILHTDGVLVEDNSGKIVYKCEVCGATFPKQSHYAKHMPLHHGPRAFICKLCNMKFGCVRHLVLHRAHRAHKVKSENPILEEKYKQLCEICGDSLPNKSSKVRHFARVHGIVDQTFPCEQCDRVFYLKRDLKQHRLDVHGDKIYVCDTCGMKFPSTVRLTFHKRKHVNYFCDVCNKEYKTMGLLKLHINKSSCKSSSEYHFINCDLCNETVLTEAYLVTHKKRMHANLPMSYHCSECDKSFRMKRDLRSHVLSVHNKSLPCQYCGMVFGQKKHLVNHIRIHTGERPFKCQQCDKSFAHSGTLAKHRIVHNKV